MNKSLEEKLAGFSPDRQRRIQAEADRLREQYLTLKQLRKARELTQAQLAETLNVKQVSIAKLEQRSDLLLSTLRNYVRGMGGELDLVVTFPGKAPVHLNGIGDADQPS